MSKRYLIGSCQLGLKNNHDTDYLQIEESGDGSRYKREFKNGEDVVTRSAVNIDRQMNFELPINEKTAKYYIINYQLDEEIIGQEFPYKYRILDKRDKYIQLLNYIADNKVLNFNKEININDWHCSKALYHVAYLTFILENNSTILTAEQKAVVQKIHDKQMPIAYLDELEEKIRNLNRLENKITED